MMCCDIQVRMHNNLMIIKATKLRILFRYHSNVWYEIVQTIVRLDHFSY
jgi:hypothetical protein